MESWFLEWVPAFQRTRSNDARQRERQQAPWLLRNQSPDILAIIAMQLPARAKMNFFATCKEFHELRDAPGLDQYFENLQERFQRAQDIRRTREIRNAVDAYRATVMAVLTFLLSFILQVVLGSLYIILAQRNRGNPDYASCTITDHLEILGWCMVSTWAINVLLSLRGSCLTMAVALYNALSHTISNALDSDDSWSRRCRYLCRHLGFILDDGVTVDLEAAEIAEFGVPLLEHHQSPRRSLDAPSHNWLETVLQRQSHQQGAAYIREGNWCAALVYVVYLMVLITCIIQAFTLWYIHQYEYSGLSEECGSTMYSMSYWLVWFMFMFLFSILISFCCCGGCFIFALEYRFIRMDDG